MTSFRLRNEYDLIVKDSNKQLEHKNKEIERLKEEKEDSVRHLNSKISNLQESLRYHQELNTKRIIYEREYCLIEE